MNIINRIKGVLVAVLLAFPVVLNSSAEEVTRYNLVQVGDRIMKLDTTVTMNLPDSVVTLLLPKPNKSNFKIKLGMLESGNRYDIVNRFGYLGKYQFSKSTLRGLVRTGYLKVDYDDLKTFMSDHSLQEKAMDALIHHNRDILFKNYKLQKYVGKNIKGITITEEGMLAAAHLLGPYSVKHFLNTGGSLKSVMVNGVTVSKYDANGTCITDYLKHFV